ncbi:histidine kinase [Pseudofrankia sp. BMG5.37]|uniref:sensor histidine kinase n=1 Tax=Pseudofrankia sp. BMG5.37 TaxID=3050035 RepID=UPI002895685C|nr:histidine kinase [Pseudofrankia sp. BMG5.37]MDT3441987.1 histidine kinase [Pseudofrankia sp. BMG5.37]
MSSTAVAGPAARRSTRKVRGDRHVRAAFVTLTSRPARSDIWLAVGLATVTVTATVLSPGDPPHRPAGLLGAALVACAAWSLVGRHSAPLAASAVTSMAVVVNSAAGFATGAVQWPAWLALFSVFAAGGLVPRLAGSALAAVAVGGYALFDRDVPTAGTFSGIAMCFLISVIAGDAARARRAYATEQQARLLGEARERELAVEQAQFDERARLAGELHDALGHAVNVVVLQAGVARRVFADNPGFARQALADIENVGREALGELDMLLRLLHPRDEVRVSAHGDGGSLGVELAGLVDRIRALGRVVELEVAPIDPALSAGVARTVYRVVREALTNAVRHSGTGRIEVRMRADPGRVTVEVFNEGDGFAGPVPGRGLAGMRERVRIEGGSFEAGPVEGGFRVLVTLPLRADGAIS